MNEELKLLLKCKQVGRGGGPVGMGLVGVGNWSGNRGWLVAWLGIGCDMGYGIVNKE